MKKAIIIFTLIFICYNRIASAQCENNEQCRNGRICFEGECRNSCNVDIDCPEPQICVNNICVNPQAPVETDKNQNENINQNSNQNKSINRQTTESESTEEEFLLLPPHSLREDRQQLSQQDYIPPLILPTIWGSRSTVSPIPVNSSQFEIAYSGGEYINDNGISGFQLMLGSESAFGKIVGLGISYPILQYIEFDRVVNPTVVTMGDLCFKVIVNVLSRGNQDYWYGISPLIRLSVNMGSDERDYYIIFEGGFAAGFSYSIFSLNFNGIILGYFMENDKVIGTDFHINPSIKILSFLSIMTDFELGYVDFSDRDNFQASFLGGLRFLIGNTVDLDLIAKVALNDGGRTFQEGGSIPGSWGIGFRVNVKWGGIEIRNFP